MTAIKRKSALYDFADIVKLLKDIVTNTAKDKVTVYSAQASFYIISSAIPFLMLLVSLTNIIFTDTFEFFIDSVSNYIPERFTSSVAAVNDELLASGGIPLLSLSGIFALWSSSKSIRSLVRGISNIYNETFKLGYLKNSVFSILYTVIFLVLILAALVVLVFGVVISKIIIRHYGNLNMTLSIILAVRGLVFFIILSLFFSLLYFGISKNLLNSEGVFRKFKTHLPGAAFASAGWMLFSYGYSLYLKYFPTVSYVYGSLAALMLLQFWIYACMFLLLLGAEVNKIMYS